MTLCLVDGHEEIDPSCLSPPSERALPDFLSDEARHRTNCKKLGPPGNIADLEGKGPRCHRADVGGRRD